MSKRSKTCNMVTKNKNQNLLCSTPEHRADSPSRDSDSLCDSDAASPVPFICTQDGTEGETDVVWNFYTPKSERTEKLNNKDTTPLSRRSKRSLRPKLIEKHLPKRKAIRTTQKNTQLFQDLIELNKNLHELITKKPYNCTDKHTSGSEDDIFSASPEYSPITKRRLSSNCLRKNVLSSNVNKQDSENAIESDDSMNECLFKASQIVEDIILKKEVKSPKILRTKANIEYQNTSLNFKTNYDSMDSIMCNIKLNSPTICRIKNNSVCLNDDSFDNLVGNLNDSALEQLTQMPVKTNVTVIAPDSIKLMTNNDSPLSKSFGRHNSMPESPSFADINNRPSSSGMVFGRYSSMPYGNHSETRTVPGDSPIRCTPDEIKKKHQQAKEKLLAKRLLPFTSSQESQLILPPPPQPNQLKINNFQEKTHNLTCDVKNDNVKRKVKFEVKTSKNSTNLKELLEKKRQEALMKLRRRQQLNHMS